MAVLNVYFDCVQLLLDLHANVSAVTFHYGTSVDMIGPRSTHFHYLLNPRMVKRMRQLLTTYKEDILTLNLEDKVNFKENGCRDLSSWACIVSRLAQSYLNLGLGLFYIWLYLCIFKGVVKLNCSCCPYRFFHVLLFFLSSAVVFCCCISPLSILFFSSSSAKLSLSLL